MIVFPRNHEEWLQERKKGLGASDAGTIIGVNEWKSNVDLWREKVGIKEAEDISDKPYVQYGHDAEPHLRALFALDHPELKVTYESPYKMIFSDEFPFIFATPDGELEEIATGRRGGLEVKTTEIKVQIKWKTKEGEIRKMIKEYPIERSEALEDIELLKEKEPIFWKHVQTKTEPVLLLPAI